MCLLRAYSVVAETEADFQATVAFAHEHNLRLVVKATGHDWYGRSAAAGSLQLWTHARANITFNDAWVPQVRGVDGLMSPQRPRNHSVCLPFPGRALRCADPRCDGPDWRAVQGPLRCRRVGGEVRLVQGSGLWARSPGGIPRSVSCRFVIGGTCDSVGVGGCWMGGCYGTLSRLYGAAAANLLEARVVLANGSLVVANAGSHPVRIRGVSP